MKILFKRTFLKGAKILGPVLAVADNFYLLDLFFFLKSRLRLKVRAKRAGLEIVTIADTRDELFRGKRVFTKEPDTIAWIDSLFRPGDVFFDIGANVGIFSLYAAKKVKGLRVFSFEPHFSNFAKLNENIYLNGLGGNITAYCLALNDKNVCSCFNLDNLSGGSAGSQYDSDRDYRGDVFKPVFRQGCVGLTLDAAVAEYKLPVPNHIKIDVDGNEALIIDGAKNVLKGPAVKSILVELSLDAAATADKVRRNEQVKAMLQQDFGFKVQHVAKTGMDSSPVNYIFVRG